MENKNIANEKRVVALVLSYFFGIFGVHRFYVGKETSGSILLLLNIIGFMGRIIHPILSVTLAIGLLWLGIDFFIIAIGHFTNSKGEKLIEWT